jgi:hypothetical protein
MRAMPTKKAQPTAPQSISARVTSGEQLRYGLHGKYLISLILSQTMLNQALYYCQLCFRCQFLSCQLLLFLKAYMHYVRAR